MWLLSLGLVGCKDEVDGPLVDVCTMAEVPYDGIDQNCDGVDLRDVDEDGHDALAVGGTDCDDDDAAIHAGATEVPYDDIDQDCADGDLLDVDGDGVDAEVVGGLDCDDDDATTLPGATDTVGNGVDNDCDGLDGVDGDQDGFASRDSAGDDCLDTDALVHPGADEVWYDGVDQDCDRVCDYDQDGDGAVLAGSPVINDSPCDVLAGPDFYAPEDCDEANPQASTVALDDSAPENGEQNVDPLAGIWVILTVPDPGPSLVVRDPDGNAVPGILEIGPEELYWYPNAPLAEGTVYQVDVTHGCGTEGFSFTTAFPPVPIDSALLVGQVWSVDIGAAKWTQPEEVSDMFASFFQVDLLMEVVAVNGDTVDLRLATGDIFGAQDSCIATADAVGDFAANPELTVGPADWPLVIDGATCDLLDATLVAGVRDDGELLVDVAIDALLDTRPLVDLLLGGGNPPDALCDLAAAFGVSCLDCPDGSGPLCLDLRIEDPPVTQFGTSITPRAQEEIDADLACP